MTKFESGQRNLYIRVKILMKFFVITLLEFYRNLDIIRKRLRGLKSCWLARPNIYIYIYIYITIACALKLLLINNFVMLLENHTSFRLRCIYLLKDKYFLRRWVKRYGETILVWFDVRAPNTKRTNIRVIKLNVLFYVSKSENCIRHDDEEINAFFNITLD